jgi:hypothetical protein
MIRFRQGIPLQLPPTGFIPVSELLEQLYETPKFQGVYLSEVH